MATALLNRSFWAPAQKFSSPRSRLCGRSTLCLWGGAQGVSITKTAATNELSVFPRCPSCVSGRWVHFWPEVSSLFRRCAAGSWARRAAPPAACAAASQQLQRAEGHAHQILSRTKRWSVPCGLCSVAGHVSTLPWLRSMVWVRVGLGSGPATAKGWVGTWPVNRLNPDFSKASIHARSPHP